MIKPLNVLEFGAIPGQNNVKEMQLRKKKEKKVGI